MRRSLLALALACALTACGGGAEAGSGGADPSRSTRTPTPTGATGTPPEAAAARACTETGLALAPLADGLAGADPETAVLSVELPAVAPSGTTPTVELALARMELELSFAKQAVELGVFGAESRSDLQAAYGNLADVCAGTGSGFPGG